MGAPVRAGRFGDPERYQREAEQVFARHWVLVADIEVDVPRPGDFLTEELAGEPLVVVRGADGDVRAFSNVCRHRAATIAEGRGSAPRGLTCPYHGWRYRLDGSLAAVPFPDGYAEDPCAQGLGLPEIPLETWGRFAFVNLTGTGPSLLDHLEGVAALVPPEVSAAAERSHTFDDVVGANWKVLLENACEDYHVPIAHRGSIGRQYDLIGGQHTFGVNTAVIDLPLRPTAGEVYDAPPGARVIGASVFPNLVVTTWPNGSFSLMSWLPRSVSTTRSRLWSYRTTGAADPRAGTEGRAFLARIQAEDYAMCERVQAGAASRWAVDGPLHELEVRLTHFRARLAQAMGEGDPDEGDGGPDPAQGGSGGSSPEP